MTRPRCSACTSRRRVATLKYQAEAEAALGLTAKARGAVGGLTGAATAVVSTTRSAIADVGAGVYGSVKVAVAASVNASARAEAQAADAAYGAGKFEDAATGYLAVYARTQQSIALYGAAQAKAQAGAGVEARGLLSGLPRRAAQGQVRQADARTLLLALGGQRHAGGQGERVSAKVDAAAKRQRQARRQGDGGWQVRRREQGVRGGVREVHGAASLGADATSGMAQFYAGATAEAATTLKAYLAAAGTLEFKASAEATVRASGGA
jgi:hypothetical protein